MQLEVVPVGLVHGLIVLSAPPGTIRADARRPVLAPRLPAVRRAREVIEAERGRTPFEFEEVDVEGDDALELEYGDPDPRRHGRRRERFEIEVDPAEFAALVRA